MDLNIRSHIKVLGMLFVIVGLSLVVPTIVAFIYKENSSIFAFLLTLAPSLLLGIALMQIKVPADTSFRARDGYIIVIESWLLASILGAIPFVIAGFIPNYFDAFFETASGFTTTGASILTNIEGLSMSMLFWRSFTHWVGGMGIIVLAVAILPALGMGSHFIISAESTGPKLTKVMPKIKDTAKVLYTLYIGTTILETILLLSAGLSLFDALTHAFATVGTGGFSTYNDGLSHFDSAYVDGIVTVFMLICGASFSLHFTAFTRGLKVYLKDSEFKGYLVIVSVTTIILTAYLFFFGTYETVGSSFRYSIFQIASIITTTGFATADFIYWPLFAQFILFLLFFVGACSSSTAGGIKIIRIIVLFKFIKRTIILKLHPNHVASVKLGGKTMSNDTVSNIISLVLLYFACLFIGTILVSIDGYDLATTFSAVASSLGNIGPGFNDVGPMLNYSGFSNFSKTILALMMIAGRLEFYTFFMLVSRKFWNPYR